MKINVSDSTIQEIKSFYGDLSNKKIIAVINDILTRYCNAEYFNPELFE